MWTKNTRFLTICLSSLRHSSLPKTFNIHTSSKYTIATNNKPNKPIFQRYILSNTQKCKLFFRATSSTGKRDNFRGLCIKTFQNNQLNEEKLQELINQMSIFTLSQSEVEDIIKLLRNINYSPNESDKAAIAKIVDATSLALLKVILNIYKCYIRLF